MTASKPLRYLLAFTVLHSAPLMAQKEGIHPLTQAQFAQAKKQFAQHVTPPGMIYALDPKQAFALPGGPDILAVEYGPRTTKPTKELATVGYIFRTRPGQVDT